MPVQASDFDYLSPGEKSLILDHIADPIRYLGTLLIASMIDGILFGVVLTEVYSYWVRFRSSRLPFMSSTVSFTSLPPLFLRSGGSRIR